MDYDRHLSPGPAPAPSPMVKLAPAKPEHKFQTTNFVSHEGEKPLAWLGSSKGKEAGGDDAIEHHLRVGKMDSPLRERHLLK